MKNLYILLILTCPIFLQAQCLQLELPFEDVVNEAEYIFQADVLSKESYWNDENTLIYTEYNLRPTRNFSRNLISSAIKLRTIGGTADGYTMYDSSSARLELNTQVVVFTKIKDGFHEVVASTQGVYDINQINKKAYSTFKSYSLENDQFYEKISSLTQSNEVIQSSIFDRNVNSETVSVLTGFSPTSITAGTGSQLTINGSDFGDAQGEVVFTNANQAGININVLSPNIISWNDTQVVIEVPSGAGTGPFAVVPVVGDPSTSQQNIIIDYNELQFVTTEQDGTQNPPATFHFFNQNGVGGMTMEYSSNFQDNPQAISLFTDAIEHWTTVSGINWQMSTQFSDNTAVEADQVNLVTLLPDSEFDSGVLGFYRLFRIAECSEGVILEYDIAFNNETNWNFTRNNPTNAQFDFYSVALHEAGHAHQQGHLISPPALMHRSIANGESKREILDGEASGAIDYIERSSALNCNVAHEPLDLSASSPSDDECNTHRLDNIQLNIWNPVYDNSNLLVAMINPGDDLGSISYLEIDLFITEEEVPTDVEDRTYMNRLITINAFDANDQIVDPLPGEFLLNIPYPQSDVQAFLNDDATTITSFPDAFLIKNDLECGDEFIGSEPSATIIDFEQSYIESNPTWMVETQVNDFSTFVVTSGEPIVLPVKWGDFFLTKEGNKVVVNWSTYSEVNSSHFIVERSNGFGIDWSEIARVSGAGDTTDFNEYQVVDTQPKNGENLYRIVQHDFDGQQDATNIESIVFENLDNAVIVTNGKAIQIFGLDQTEIKLYDVYGRLVYVKNHQSGIEHQLNHLESGIYFIAYELNGEIKNQKVILN